MQLQKIPEILLHVSNYLTQPDLSSCVQINRDWNNILVPILWNSIDDSLLSWNRLLETYDSSDNNDQGEESDEQRRSCWNEAWIRALLIKYGPHIRHLKVSWISLLDAVSRSETCTRIISLEVGDLMSNRTRKQEWDSCRLNTLTGLEKEAYYRELKELGGDEMIRAEDLLSPIFEGAILNPTTTTRKEQREWLLTLQRFLLFLRTTATGLKRLHLNKSLRLLGEIHSRGLLYMILADLRELRELNVDMCSLSMDALLRRLPKLEVLRSTEVMFIFDQDADSFPNDHSILLDGVYKNLCSLSMWENITVFGFACLLRCLPSLKALCIGGFMEDVDNDDEEWNDNEDEWDYTATTLYQRTIHSAMGGGPSSIPNRLEEIRLMSQFAATASPILSALFPWLPHLRRLTVDKLPATQIHDLLKNYPHFESICESPLIYQGYPHVDHHSDYSEGSFTPIRFLEVMPTLKCFDMIYLQLSIDSFVESRRYRQLMSSPARELEIFRCQIKNVKRWSEEDRALYESNVREMELDTEEQFSRGYQAMFLRIIGECTQLRVLEFGYDNPYGERWIPTTTIAETGEVVVEEGWDEEQIIESNKAYYCLELTLDAGLDELVDLKELQVFGCCGMDHLIGEEEVEWMAENWPKLRVVRGLCGEGDKDVRLRAIMKQLRPEVRFERLVDAYSMNML
ncbi:hypothetical protein BGZ95_002960 [Linnemannia exigua]|uniref:F-box domain-containing protein n=1 Tax=Linnemannia exigua TaxID=604196 RepID=A0AAD4H9C5_9FUNG|nr:hypothetical protein BGZ95_002960 [Linnemannia exigua]